MLRRNGAGQETMESVRKVEGSLEWEGGAKVLPLYDDDKCIVVSVAVLIMPAGRDDDRLLLTAPRHATLHATLDCTSVMNLGRPAA